MATVKRIAVSFVVFLTQMSLLHAHREHKVHNIVLYPDKHSWCKTTPIKQVVTGLRCSLQELDNNVCVGACFSYMVPHSEPSAPGDLIRPYCDSCQPLNSVWKAVTLDCKDEDNNAITMQKKVQIITNCSCSSCTETSRIKPDYNTLLQSMGDEIIDKNVNTVHDTPDILLNLNLNDSKNTSKDGLQANEKILQLLKQLRSSENMDEPGAEEFFTKFEEEIDLKKLHEVLRKSGQDDEQRKKHHQQHHQTNKQTEHESHESHHGGSGLSHRGPHHSMVLDPDVKEKIDVEPHYLHPAVAGQEISYHDNVVVDKTKKKEVF